MKKLTLSLFAAATLGLVACGGAKTETTNEAADLANEVVVAEEVVTVEEVNDSTVVVEDVTVTEMADSTVVVEETVDTVEVEEAHEAHEGHEAH